MAATAAAALMLAAACGDGALSHDEYLRQGNAICADINEQRTEIATDELPADEPPTAEQFQAFARRFGPRFDEEVDRIEALEPPSQDEGALTATVEAARRVVTDLERVTDDVAFAKEVLASEEGDVPSSEDANEAAKEAGLTACAG